MMELTFITMHSLDRDCGILYASDSISDVLGYAPEDVVGKSAFDFFHPDELPVVRDQHKDIVELDRASVLAYVRVRDIQGQWIHCECVFSCVYDVIIAATTIYRPDSFRSQGRAMAASVVEAAFSRKKDPLPRQGDRTEDRSRTSSDETDDSRRSGDQPVSGGHRADQRTSGDVRYAMLAHMSARFTSIAPNALQEPRAALILNRFTHNLTIMYATHAVHDMFGLDPVRIVGSSFWDCVAPEALDGAIDAINRAKQNDSVAYMRFGWQNPIVLPYSPLTTQSAADTPPSMHASASDSDSSLARSSSGERSNSTPDSTREVYVDVECVVTCSSDGLILVVRRTDDTIRSIAPPSGLFAVPWSTVPLFPPPPPPKDDDGDVEDDAESAIVDDDDDDNDNVDNSSVGEPRSRGAADDNQRPANPQTGSDPDASGDLDDRRQAEVLDSIQEVAVFVWGMQLNEDVVREHARGTPGPGAQPSRLQRQRGGDRRESPIPIDDDDAEEVGRPALPPQRNIKSSDSNMTVRDSKLKRDALAGPAGRTVAEAIECDSDSQGAPSSTPGSSQRTALADNDDVQMTG